MTRLEPTGVFNFKKYIYFFCGNIYFNLCKVMVCAILLSMVVIGELLFVENMLNYFDLPTTLMYSVILNLVLLFLGWTHKRTMLDIQYYKWDNEK